MAENKRGSNMEKNNSQASESASVIIGKLAGPVLLLHCALNWAEIPRYWVKQGRHRLPEVCRQITLCLHGSLSGGLGNTYGILLSCESELLSHVQLKRNLSPGLASLRGWPRSVPCPSTSLPAFSPHLPNPGSYTLSH